jgi:hypothetical protein
MQDRMVDNPAAIVKSRHRACPRGRKFLIQVRSFLIHVA